MGREGCGEVFEDDNWASVVGTGQVKGERNRKLGKGEG